MTPSYGYYTGGAVIVNGSTVYATYNYGVDGLTTCSGGCPSGVTHTPFLEFGFNGKAPAEYFGSSTPPQQYLDFQLNETDSSQFFPFTGKQVVMNAWVECSRIGQISSTNIPINSYFSSATTFYKAQANSSNLNVDCGVSGDGTPAWEPVPVNPFGSQGSNPSPLYLEFLGVVYSATPPPASSFISWAAGVGNLVYSYRAWQHSNGSPAPMPQVCTQLKTGLTQYNPGYIVPPQ